MKNYNCEYKIKINIDPSINTDNDMITFLEELCKKERKAENYVTEASFIENSKAIILGLGPITAHQCNECVELEKLNELINIYIKIIEKYCY